MIINFTAENFDREIANGLVLVDFWATWCGPCRMQGKIIEEAAPALESLGVKIGKVNVDEEEALAVKFGVSAIPTLLVFKDGELKKQAVGVQNLMALKDMLES